MKVKVIAVEQYPVYIRSENFGHEIELLEHEYNAFEKAMNLFKEAQAMVS